ncbi:unnamed protein product [Rotaria socialis]|uniref:Uncharacterized protein n=1 Tax=Rotaria socialis TaxID=392032 RepID=A0A821QYY4_9BILA|nr:unnamed protein product [Rotaria socialis]
MWDSGATVGTVIAGTSDVFRSIATTLKYANSFTFDSNKNLYVADSNNVRIQKYFTCSGVITTNSSTSG